MYLSFDPLKNLSDRPPNMNNDNSGTDKNDEIPNAAPVLEFDVEEGLQMRRENTSSSEHNGDDDNASQGVPRGDEESPGQSRRRKCLDGILKNESEEGLYYDGKDAVKVLASDCDNSCENDCYENMQGGESASQTTSVAAAVPTTLRASRRESVPGAFRISSAGATAPGVDHDEAEEFSQTNLDIVGLRASFGPEVLVEAMLVRDQSQMTSDIQRDQEHSHSLHHSPSDPANVALVEAKPLRRFCFCEILGNWKSILFLLLVIVAIAGIAFVIERTHQITQKHDLQGLKSPTPRPSAPSPVATARPSASSGHAAASNHPTENESATAPAEQELAPSFNPTVFITSSPSTEISSSPFPSPDEGSYSPTSTPTNSLILPLPPQTLAALDDPESPQSLALEWLTLDPNRNRYSDNGSKLQQRFALATVYFALDGNNWPYKDNWLSYQVDECEWYRNLSIIDSVCSDEGQYETLSLFFNEPGTIVGSLPREIWLLTSLVSLNLFAQNIYGTLPLIEPDEMGNIADMTELALFDLSLSGTIPSIIGELGKLTTLQLQQNQFTGTIFSEIGGMEKLQRLLLDQNKLSGSLPSDMANMRNLELLYLAENMLSGPLPPEIFASWTALRVLDIGGNRFWGQIYTEIGLLRSLEVIDMFNNSLSGSLPSEIARLHNITTLMFDGNSLEGQIPSQLGLMTNLQRLWLHNNALTGSVPFELCDLVKERSLDLSIDCARVSCGCSCECG